MNILTEGYCPLPFKKKNQNNTKSGHTSKVKAQTDKKPKSKELKVYGFYGCRKLFDLRPEGVIRVYLTEKKIPMFKDLLQWCAQNKKAYHVVTDEDMEKVTESVHHEGICILAQAVPSLSQTEFFQAIAKNDHQTSCLIFLDDVQNPHNLGAILRVCAHFGSLYILGAKQNLPVLSSSACRIAEGGAELVRLVNLDQPNLFFKEIKRLGFHLVATSSHRGQSIFSYSLPSKVIYFLGAESFGLGEDFFRVADVTVKIPGTDQVESLNVSVAAGILLGEFYRVHPRPSVT